VEGKGREGKGSIYFTVVVVVVVLFGRAVKTTMETAFNHRHPFTIGSLLVSRSSSSPPAAAPASA
jgi:hypothetical protein